MGLGDEAGHDATVAGFSPPQAVSQRRQQAERIVPAVRGFRVMPIESVDWRCSMFPALHGLLDIHVQRPDQEGPPVREPLDPHPGRPAGAVSGSGDAMLQLYTGPL